MPRAFPQGPLPQSPTWQLAVASVLALRLPGLSPRACRVAPTDWASVQHPPTPPRTARLLPSPSAQRGGSGSGSSKGEGPRVLAAPRGISPEPPPLPRCSKGAGGAPASGQPGEGTQGLPTPLHQLFSGVSGENGAQPTLHAASHIRAFLGRHGADSGPWTRVHSLNQASRLQAETSLTGWDLGGTGTLRRLS